MKVLNHEQGTPAWLQARAGIATASEFDSIMARVKSGEAASRRNYRAKLVVERLTGRPVTTFQSAAMRQGTEREPDARVAYMVHTGAVVDQVGLCRHDDLEAGASPDGLIGTAGGLEIKCPELANHLDYLKQTAEPAEYAWQIQGGLWIAEREWWDFVSFNPEFPEHLQLIVRRVYRDEKRIQALADEVARFMDEVRAEEIAIRSLPLAA